MITSPSQIIHIDYGAQVTSAEVNKKIYELIGGNANIDMVLTQSAGQGRNIKIGPGRISIKGATIEEAAQLTLPLPTNVSGSTVTYYIYAVFTEGDVADNCIYDAYTSPTVSPNALQLLVVNVANNYTNVDPTAVTIAAPSIRTLASSFQLKSATSDETSNIRKLNFANGAYMSGESGTPTGTNPVLIDGYLKATRVYNPYLTDYAEWFECDTRIVKTEPGDIIGIDFDSQEESYRPADSKVDFGIVGVHSDDYAQCIGGNGVIIDGKCPGYIAVAMAGRVHVKVIGTANKGDIIVMSGHLDGVGCAVPPYEKGKWQTIGICLESKPTTELGKVRCLLMLGR